ncbi:N-acetylglucosamine-6-phosphate deacetylase [Paracoccus sp. 1_MG-2023]|uniref:N-acetylglucosamine-6-phosphate deacetylase n=1 Tax=unclassified Paracoccus (in: a-proteobacteria) TaxID=2688777 RepID=UPI001C08AB9E|nr:MULTISPECIES: N-acetylglucosamine-6-phosphate deacetylase [unclassified Paracoccus (in: a-proteobacteria)]MBU2956333.1 N-acetylglucosamine-6-phosphate deacetylase [Paracoccus sp. C2R09]MDO6668009.1 N-acetylglucosamine-6-phosphate deacetylase [Paracoccus sp. 1_MG-2023]
MLIGVKSLWNGGRLLHDMAFEVASGEIAAIRPLGADTPDTTVALASPLLCDLQVNGSGGVMVNSTPTPDGLRAIAAAQRRCGTGAILPTVITDTPDVIEAAAEAALEAFGHDGIAGLHIEGPHLSAQRRGTHKEAFIRPLDDRTVTLVERLRAAGMPVMITLAPELADPVLFSRLVASGAVVSAGHTMATAEETRDALERGLSCFTHLYNAMPPMTARAPGVLGAALNSRAHAGIIVDGIHVDWDMLRVALRSRPAPGLTFAVSDAMATVGGPDHFEIYGQTIRVRDGMLVNAEGSLAGAHIDLRQSLANLVNRVGLPLSEALPMVCDIPRRVMGLAPAQIAPGQPIADTLLLNDDFQLIELT